MVEKPRVELGYIALQAIVLPLYYFSMVLGLGFAPRSKGRKPPIIDYYTNRAYMYPFGFEPKYCGCKPHVLPGYTMGTIGRVRAT